MQNEPVLQQRIFEARFERGYRYLDRCGDVMLILEELLNGLTGCIWIPKEMAPSGAQLFCPDLDVNIVFNSYRFVIDQDPVGDIQFDFEEAADHAFATLRGRLGLERMQRFGSRRLSVVGTDCLDDAEAVSVRRSFAQPLTVAQLPDGFEARAYEHVANFETPDRSKGIRVCTKPFARIGADVKVDDRLRMPPHHLPEGQHDALVEQLRRQRLREQDPQAGWLVDIDYFWIRPTQGTVTEFLKDARRETERVQTVVASARGSR